MKESSEPTAPATVEDSFEALLEFLRANRGFDFTGYKRPSLQRRIDRRMQTVGLSDYGEYTEYLAAHEQEFAELFNTILINVTGFFRDAAAWEVVARDVVPRIIEGKGDSDGIRVWSAGCASGEEAYTAAILFAEALGEAAFRERVKVYATDVDEEALTEGRHAAYAGSSLDDVKVELRESYFEEANGRFVFRRDLRPSVIFGRHDLMQDPPISRIDLLLARNTLMYFSPDAQRKILGDFHFALNREGFLFLGKSEVLLTRSNFFQPVDLKRRIFAKLPQANMRERLRQMAETGHATSPEVSDDSRIRQAGFEAAPIAQIVVDRAGQLTLANAQARRLFGLTPRDVGRPLQDLELSYRPVELRSRIDEVHTNHHPVTVREVEWRIGGDLHALDVHLSELSAPDGGAIGVAVTFTDVTRYRRLQDSFDQSKERLETAYEELQSTAEELETTNEELQSTNEELETTNEELQSTNEELETMNEELQSTNEELETMNDELRQRTDEVNQVNAFLESILGSLQAGVVVVDQELRVQAWNERARELWGLTADEVQGRHLLNLDIGLQLDAVAPLIRSCLDGSDGAGEPQEHDAVNRRGRPIRVRVSCAPLLGPRGEMRGVIVQMEDLGPAGGDG